MNRSFFSHDGESYETHATAADARAAVEKALARYADYAGSDGWSEAVTNAEHGLFWGQICGEVAQTSCVTLAEAEAAGNGALAERLRQRKWTQQETWELVDTPAAALRAQVLEAQPALTAPPADTHFLLTDDVLAQLREPEWAQALAAADAGEDPRPIAHAGLQRRFRSYEGGDRPSSPPAALLLALLSLERAMAEDSSSATRGRSHEAVSAPAEAASAVGSAHGR